MTKYDYSYGANNLEDMPRELLSFVLIILAVVGIVWLVFKDVPAGNVYFSLVMFGIATLVLIFFYTKSTHSGYKIPLGDNLNDAVNYFVIGLLAPLLLFGVPLLFGAKSIVTSKVFVPLAFGSQSAISQQTFAALSAITDPFWKAFVVTISAGVLETFVINFAAVAFGIMLGYLIRKLASMDFGSDGDKTFDFIIAMIFSTAFFIILHQLNQSYTTSTMFITAGIFLVLMNISVYLLNLTLLFAAGFHIMNNAISIGLSDTFYGFLSSGYGFVILGLFALILYSFLVNIRTLPVSLKKTFKRVGL